MTITVKTYFDGKEIKVPRELRKLEPTEVTLIFEDGSGEKEKPGKGLPLMDEMVAISKSMTGTYPEDLARNHDYYLHGKQKR